MILSPMRFKDYTWPHNPRTYQIEFKRYIADHKIPFGSFTMQTLGRTFRVLKGEGEFAGEGAYEQFRALGTVFYDDTPGVLVHPIWQTANAYFVSLSLKEEPREDYVSYAFEFWEIDGAHKPELTVISGTNAAQSAAFGLQNAANITAQTGSEAGRGTTYTVVSGDCLWNIANRYSLSLAQLLNFNPQIKNPNLIHPGDSIRVG